MTAKLPKVTMRRKLSYVRDDKVFESFCKVGDYIIEAFCSERPARYSDRRWSVTHNDALSPREHSLTLWQAVAIARQLESPERAQA